MKSYAVIVGVALLMVACVSAHVIVTKFHNPLCIGRGEAITYLQDETADTTRAPYYDAALGPAPAPAKRTDPVLGFLEATRCELGRNYSFALSEDAACTVLGDEFLVGLPETCNLVTSEIEWTHGLRTKRVVKTRPARWECDKRWDCPELEGDSMTVFCHDGHPMFHDWIEIEVCSASTTPTSPPHVSPPPPHVSPPPPTAVPISPPHVSPPPPHVSPPPPHVSPPPPATVPVGTAPLPLLEPTLEPLEVLPLKRWDTCDCSGKLTQIKTWLDVEGCQRVYTTGNVLARRGALWATGDWVLVPADHSCPADEGAYTVSFYADANCSTPTSGYHTIAGACALNGDLNVNMYCSGRTIHVSPPPPHVSPPPPHVSPPPPTTVPTSPPHVSPPPPHVSPPPPHVSPPPPHVSPPPSVVVLPPDGSAAEPGVATPTSNAPLASAPASSAPQQSLVFSVVVLAFSLPLLISLF